ncbi:MAG TPA: MlaD family protein [Candidatus Binataceae bacterium]|nr:MlaD family protein [Candidatus Binataceae bacterium]
MGKHVSPTLVGLFVLGAIAIAGTAVVILASGRLFTKTFRCVLFFSGDVNGLRVGAPVKFRGVEIGSVSRILLTLDEPGQNHHTQLFNITIPVVIELNENRILSHGLRIENPQRTIKNLVASGLRGQLAIESLVTGMLYVALDMKPGSKPHFVLPQPSVYTEIPTVQTEYQKAQSALSRLVGQLDEVNITHLTEALTGTLDGANRLLNAPGLQQTLAAMPVTLHNLNESTRKLDMMTAQFTELARDLRGQSATLSTSLRQTSQAATQTLDQARLTFAQLGVVTQPDSPLNYQLLKTLRDLSAAAAATQRLADYLQRNPSALVRGRAAGAQ